MSESADDELVALVAEALSRVPGVVAVSLGGSRARGSHGDASDFDFGVYYRSALDTDAIRALGWSGEVFEPGAWGGGVFNGGAWLTLAGRKVDLIYRDLDDVEFHLAEARAGRFRREYLPFYLAGVPTYVVVGELATHRVLVGELERPDYPAALAEAAGRRWHESARSTLGFGRVAHVARGDVVGAAGALCCAVLEESHARLASARAWVLNEKGLARRAGLGHLDERLGRLGTGPADLAAAFDAVEAELLGG